MLWHTPSTERQEHRVSNREQRALVDELAKLPNLRECSKDDLRALAEAGRVVTLPDGWAFVREGTPADAAYILLEGEAHVLLGREVVDSIGPGAILGEMAYLDGGQRHATVATHGRVRAVRLDYDELDSLLKKRKGLENVLRAADREHRGRQES
jgi:CRP/FNR family transcriptional regulator, cyclic AMP receptor protein